MDWRNGQAEAYARTQQPDQPPPTERHVAAVLLAVLVVLSSVEVYTCVRLGQVKESLQQHLAAQSDTKQTKLAGDLETRMAALERANRMVARAQKSGGTEEDMSSVASQVSSTQQELRRSLSAAQKFQAEQQRSTQELGHQLAAKADQRQVGALSENVSATRQDLDSAKKRLEDTIAQLGMTRSQLGTLIARNHDEIAKLRELGERDYFEFTLNRFDRPQSVAGMGLQLKRTDTKRLRYTLDVYADDYRIEKKDRGINEAVSFHVRDSQQPVELVVNQVGKESVTGYLSAAKGTIPGGAVRPDPTDDPEWEPFKTLKKQTPSPIKKAAGPSR